jgi:hypothetical protein
MFGGKMKKMTLCAPKNLNFEKSLLTLRIVGNYESCWVQPTPKRNKKNPNEKGKS